MSDSIILGAFNLFSLWIIKIYLDTFMYEKSQSVVQKGCWYFSILWEVMCTFLNLQPVANFISSILLVFGIATIIYEGTYVQRIFLMFVINVIWMLSELLAWRILIVFGVHLDEIGILGAMSSKFITYIIIKIMSIWGKNKLLRNFKNIYGYGLFLIPISSIVLIVSILKITFMKLKYEGEFTIISSYLIILLINVYVFKLYERCGYEIEIERNNLLFNNQIELCNQEFKEYIRSMERFRAAKHDFKHQLTYIQKLIDNNEIQKCRDFILNLNDSLKPWSQYQIVNTGNLVMDSMINSKFCLAREHNIQFNISIMVPPNIEISDNDACILWGNSLDNAIEANKDIDKAERFISVFIKYTKGTLIISIVNSCSGIAKMNRKGDYVTTKADAKNHGVGLQSIKKIIQKYNGTMEIELSKNRFILKILLYI